MNKNKSKNQVGKSNNQLLLSMTMMTKVDLGTHHNNFRGEISHSK
jgi:hypothetical protein